MRLPKPLADELGLSPGKTVELERRGTRITVETAVGPKIPSYNLDDFLARIKPGDAPPFEDWSAVEVPWPDDDWSDIAPTDEDMGVARAGGRRKRS